MSKIYTYLVDATFADKENPTVKTKMKIRRFASPLDINVGSLREMFYVDSPKKLFMNEKMIAVLKRVASESLNEDTAKKFMSAERHTFMGIEIEPNEYLSDSEVGFE